MTKTNKTPANFIPSFWAEFEDIFKCVRAELGPQDVSPEGAQYLYNKGLITAPKGAGGRVVPSDKALDLYGIFDAEGFELREGRKAFDGSLALI